MNFGTATITQSTLSGNTAPFGADILNFTGFSLSISMSIVAGGLDGSNCGGQAFLQGAVSEYSGIAITGSLDTAAVGSGTSTTAASGPTGSATAGELLFSGLMTGASPGTVTVGGGLTMREQTAGFSADDADGKVVTAGPQDVSWTLQNAADWYDVAALFRAAP